MQVFGGVLLECDCVACFSGISDLKEHRLTLQLLQKGTLNVSGNPL